MTKYLTMAEVAKLKGVSVSAVHRWVVSGHLKLTRAAMPRETTMELVKAMQRPKMGRPKGAK
jgi:predicted site-specific integrase-resolvase